MFRSFYGNITTCLDNQPLVSRSLGILCHHPLVPVLIFLHILRPLAFFTLNVVFILLHFEFPLSFIFDKCRY